MRFKSKYKHNQVRQVTKFLWFPKKICGETRWLEKATWEEDYFLAENFDGWWTSRKWID